ncbi:class I SAM-dependent methyltransferase [Nonomuraea jiangxiensis]|uniref:O-methyltransferase / aklanonic acid methyltransferase n=1 Tax=Nonomuraea jiangxiensis TaxID=633440 RepID=A0A1G8VI74_9ACTN|nr:methyltransferase domain-containing protein [Nonomuraea jiangxiensis]SDJ65713.1 O-methyltransferase / aklanonic acid methyltransferase [Nonomuraea jiangxiensis]
MDAKEYMAGVFDRASGTYERVGVSFFAPVAEELVRRAAPGPGEHVLDAGCGTGASLVPAAQAVGPTGRVVGLDLAPGMVATATAAIERHGLTQATVLLGDAERAEELLPGERFDVVLAGMMLYFLPDPLAAVRSMTGLLRPGGRLAASLLARSSPVETELLGLVEQALRPYAREAGSAPFHHTLGTPEELTGLLEQGGLSEVRWADVVFEVVVEAGQVWDWLWSAARRAALETIPADQRDEARAALEAALPQDRFVLPRTVRFATGRT